MNKPELMMRYLTDRMGKAFGETCEACSGAGEVDGKPCGGCSGQGMVIPPDSLSDYVNGMCHGAVGAALSAFDQHNPSLAHDYLSAYLAWYGAMCEGVAAGMSEESRENLQDYYEGVIGFMMGERDVPGATVRPAEEPSGGSALTPEELAALGIDGSE